jgi:hypothetical protein
MVLCHNEFEEVVVRTEGLIVGKVVHQFAVVQVFPVVRYFCLEL